MKRCSFESGIPAMHVQRCDKPADYLIDVNANSYLHYQGGQEYLCETHMEWARAEHARLIEPIRSKPVDALSVPLRASIVDQCWNDLTIARIEVKG